MYRRLRVSPTGPLLAALLCCSAPQAEEPFYRQLIDLSAEAGYSPTRTFAIVVDSDNDNRLVASDDPDLQFNLGWLDRFQPEHQSREGGAALGLLLRSWLRTLYDEGREQRAVTSAYVPDGDVDVSLGNFGGEMEYHLRVKQDEFNLRLEYSY